MKLKWFKEVTTLEELDRLYIKLARQHHPDIGGNENTMKEINVERDELRQAIKSGIPLTGSPPMEDQYFDLDELLWIAKARGYKIGWVAIQALKFARSYEDCLRIARACHYKDGWAWHKWKEMESR